MTTSGSGSGKRTRAKDERVVLFVDDYVDSCLVYAEAMFALGVRVEMSRDGADGLAKAQRLRPAAIVMDLALPGMDGIELTRRLKIDPRTARIPVVALTGLSLDKAMVLAIEAGCCTVLEKPCSPERIARVIEGILLDLAASAAHA
jgi:two-component system cell cycle response regulator